jgi:hypothetical protein
MLCNSEVPIPTVSPPERTNEGDFPPARTISFAHLESSHRFTAVHHARSTRPVQRGHGTRQAIGVPSGRTRSGSVTTIATLSCCVGSEIWPRPGSSEVGTLCTGSEHSVGESSAASPDFSANRVQAGQSSRKTGPYRQCERENPINPGDSRGRAASPTHGRTAGYTASSGKFSSTSFSLLRKNAAIAPSTTR